MRKVFYMIMPLLLSCYMLDGEAESGKKSVENDETCNACYSVNGELSRTTKFSVISSDRRYTIIEMKNGDVYVYDGNLTLGPVGVEIEMIVKPGLGSFPSELRSTYSHAATAIRVDILSFPSGIEGIRFTP